MKVRREKLLSLGEKFSVKRDTLSRKVLIGSNERVLRRELFRAGTLKHLGSCWVALSFPQIRWILELVFQELQLAFWGVLRCSRTTLNDRSLQAST